jgi:hypothetical protein
MTTSEGKHFRKTVPWAALVSACIAVAFLGSPGDMRAEPLEHNSFASVAIEGIVSQIDGRMGFEQEPDALVPGSLNDLQADLGLPREAQTVRLGFAIRPLEHHALRLYGTVPEIYKGGRILTRTLQTRRGTYPTGTSVESKLSTGSFGFGYDLDFLVGPRWYAGLNGDLKYLHARVTMSGAGVGLDDTIAVDEMMPCLGAHGEAKLPVSGIQFGQPMTLGGFARMVYGVTPNFLNHVDIWVGASLDLRTSLGPAVSARVGYEHEVFMYTQELVAGKIFEYSKNGIFLSIAGVF